MLPLLLALFLVLLPEAFPEVPLHIASQVISFLQLQQFELKFFFVVDCAVYVPHEVGRLVQAQLVELYLELLRALVQLHFGTFVDQVAELLLVEQLQDVEYVQRVSPDEGLLEVDVLLLREVSQSVQFLLRLVDEL